MKTEIVLILLFFTPSISNAGNIAVNKTNYSVSGSYQDSDKITYSVHGRIATPIKSYGGAAITAGYSISSYDINYIDSNSWFSGVELFVRDKKKVEQV